MTVGVANRQLAASEAVAAARAVQRFAARGVVAAVVTVTACIGMVLAAAVFGSGGTVYIAVLWTFLLAGSLPLAFRAVARAAIKPPSGVRLEPEDAPGLYRLVAETATELGVGVPSAVLVSHDMDAWLHLTRDESILVVGAPLLWGLEADELQRVLASEIVLMRFVDDPQIRRALLLAARVRAAKIGTHPAPGATWLLQTVVRGLHRRAARLGDACREAGDLQVDTVGLRATEADLRRLSSVEACWNLVVTRWAAHAWARGLAPRQLMAGFAAVARALDELDQHERGLPPGRGVSAVVGLMNDPVHLDERVSAVLGESAAGCSRPELEWDDYLESVVAPVQRDQAAALYAAVDRALGRRIPATLDALFGVLEHGWAAAVGAQLAPANRESTEHRHGDVRDDALIAYIRAAIITASVDAGVARREMDWAFGLFLVDGHGRPLLLDAAVSELLLRGDATEVRRELSVWGVRLDDPLWLGGSEPRERAYPEVVFLVWQGWRPVHLVLTGDRVLLLRDPALWGLRAAAKNLTGISAHADRQQTVLTTPVGDLATRFDVHAQMRYADITALRLKARSWAQTWRCRLRTTEGVVAFSGMGSGSALAQLLDREIGDRLEIRGPVGDDLADRRGLLLVAKIIAAVGAVFLTFGAVMGLALEGKPQPSVVKSCSSAMNGGATEYSCAATVDLGDVTGKTTLHPLRWVPPGTVIEVRVTEVPVIGPVIVQPNETRPLMSAALAVGTPMVVAGAPYISVVRRRRKSLQDAS